MASVKEKDAVTIFKTLSALYPNVTTFLNHKSPFELLIAVILSAQCTDERVNMVTPGLFADFPTPKDLANAPLDGVIKHIKSVTYFNAKAKNIIQTANQIHTIYNDEVPANLDALITLPGVGRKTANVVLGQAFGIPGITVDTHVKRLTQRLGFTKSKQPEKIEQDLMKIWPKSIWSDFSTVLIVHGRQICQARSPQCTACKISEWCPSKK